jgi:hypothetical protein
MYSDRMARWNVSGETITLESGRRRPVEGFLARYGLRIAIVVGVVEAVLAWVYGFERYLLVFALAVVFGYIWARRRLPRPLRRPAWVLAASQVIAGLAPLAVGAGLLIAVMIGALLLVIGLLVLLGDRRRL